MTTLYKLTTADGYTRKGEYNQCKWGENITHSGTGKGELCGPGYIHAYTSPLLAVLLNPIHANLKNPILWEAEGDVVKGDNGLKVGCVSLTTIKQIPLPELTTDQKVAFAILCAKQVFKGCKVWNDWANAWLNGIDRAADAAYAAADAAARAAADAAARAAARAAADAARAAADAAYAAADAAYAAAYAAYADFDLIQLANQAYSIK